jgi:uncharacterized membrane protein YebE (DUF533 family)
MSLPPWLAAHEDGPLVFSLLCVAWADGALGPHERAALGELVERLAIEVSPEDLAAWLATPPDPDVVIASVTDPVVRRFVIYEACLLAVADGEAAAGEEALVARWAGAWGIGDEELAELRDEARANVSARSPT